MKLRTFLSETGVANVFTDVARRCTIAPRLVMKWIVS